MTYVFQNLNEDDIKKELLVLQEERHHYEMRAKVLSCVSLTCSNQSQVIFHLFLNYLICDGFSREGIFLSFLCGDIFL